VGRLIGAFKTVASKKINQIRNTSGQPTWQRNYYEHVVRSEDNLNRIRRYILDNPVKWSEDEDNPANISRQYERRGILQHAPTNKIIL
jgi:hypothetical protein